MNQPEEVSSIGSRISAAWDIYIQLSSGEGGEGEEWHCLQRTINTSKLS